MMIRLTDNYIDMSLFNKYYKDTQNRQGFLTIQQIGVNEERHPYYSFKNKKMTVKQEQLECKTSEKIYVNLPDGKYCAKFYFNNISHSIILNVKGAK